MQVNFGKPIPLFPLDQVTLLPHQVLPLHIFEPRYRQMVKDALDGAGLIAMAVFRDEDWKQQYHGRPALRPAVCVGHIWRHERSEGGRYNLLLRGVCRARILEELPADKERLYRAAMLEPVGVREGGELAVGEEQETLDHARARVTQMLSDGPLAKHQAAEQGLEVLRNEDVPTAAALEWVSSLMAGDPKVRYRLLAEADAGVRAGVLLGELGSLERIVRMAINQHPEEWPRGLSWN